MLRLVSRLLRFHGLSTFCRLFNARSIFIQSISSISNNSVSYKYRFSPHTVKCQNCSIPNNSLQHKYSFNVKNSFISSSSVWHKYILIVKNISISSYWEDKRGHTFPNGITKVNVLARMEYELAYYDSAVHRFNNYPRPLL